MENWQIKHEAVIKEFLNYINKNTNDFILKGGTALRQCYHMDRFSEDIDFDSQNKNLEKYIKEFCNKNGYTYNKKKDTDTVKRFMINYGNPEKPLKIETSYRKKEIDEYSHDKINGIEVYDIDTLATMKSIAYTKREKIRDLYDVAFICNNYINDIEQSSKLSLQEALERKGLEQYDILINEQSDPLIDNDKLLEDFLNAWDKIGLNFDKDEKEKYQIKEKETNLDKIIENAKDSMSSIDKTFIKYDDFER